MNAYPAPKFLTSFGRNRGRKLRPHQQGLVDTLLPRIAIELDESGLESSSLRAQRSNPENILVREAHAGLPRRFAPRNDGIEGDVPYQSIALEIGFGGGEHLVAQAAHHPETLFIGCEPFINGVAKCLSAIEAQQLTNIRLFTDDARMLLQALPEQSIDSVFILFPDPWPKARHNKRRLVNRETLDMLACVQKPGGRLLIATDHEDYSVWILEQLLVHPEYVWTAEAQADWLTPPADWTETKYQRKTSAEGRPPLFFECVRK